MPSLRANGSRERAPDDRLREAIHLTTQRKNGCFVASAPRNDEGGPLFLRYRANAFILMDCAVKPADDEKSEQPWKSAHAT
jgi:hypothetical protein